MNESWGRGCMPARAAHAPTACMKKHFMQLCVAGRACVAAPTRATNLMARQHRQEEQQHCRRLRRIRLHLRVHKRACSRQTPCPPAEAASHSRTTSVLYVSVGTKIMGFNRDRGTGALTRNTLLDSGAPAGSLAADPTSRYLYAALGGPSGGNQPADAAAAEFNGPAVASFRISQAGHLTLQGSTPLIDGSQFIATDTTGRHLFASHFSVYDGEPGGGISLLSIDEYGTVTRTLCRHRTAFGAHSVQTDPSNRWVFSPATAPLGRWERAGEAAALSNGIFQFEFDADSGKLEPHPTQPRVAGADGQGPRHMCLGRHGTMAYTSDEQGCSVTAYKLDTVSGTLEACQSVSTIEESKNTLHQNWTCSQIRIHPDGTCLFAPTRGHDTITSFAIDRQTGLLSLTGRVSAPRSPRGVNIAPDGRYLYAAGNQTAKIAVYSIDLERGGQLRQVFAYDLDDGKSSSWLLPLDLPPN